MRMTHSVWNTLKWLRSVAVTEVSLWACFHIWMDFYTFHHRHICVLSVREVQNCYWHCEGLEGSDVIPQSQGLICDCWAWNRSLRRLYSSALPVCQVLAAQALLAFQQWHMLHNHGYVMKQLHSMLDHHLFLTLRGDNSPKNSSRSWINHFPEHFYTLTPGAQTVYTHYHSSTSPPTHTCTEMVNTPLFYLLILAFPPSLKTSKEMDLSSCQFSTRKWHECLSAINRHTQTMLLTVEITPPPPPVYSLFFSLLCM